MKQLFHFFLGSMTAVLAFILALTAVLTSIVPISLAVFAAIALTSLVLLVADRWGSIDRRGDGETTSTVGFWRDLSLLHRIGAPIKRPAASSMLV